MPQETHKRELEPPPMANRDANQRKLRVWAAPDQPQQVTLRTTSKNAGKWGLLLADIARHAAKAYANEGHEEREVLARIKQFLNAEFSDPTDTVIQIA